MASAKTSSLSVLAEGVYAGGMAIRGGLRYTLLAVVCLVLFYNLPKSKTVPVQRFNAAELVTEAPLLLPVDLMARPLVSNHQYIPKLFHQSWSSRMLPAKFEHWTETCKQRHPDWEWVHWTDEDNGAMVAKYFPWLLEAYQKLPGPIYRADMVRNAYMFLFGGIYADMDTECLRPADDIFAEYNITTAHHENTLQMPVISNKYDQSSLKAFFGRMGTEESFEHSIPNAWMASPPGHPFFLLMLEWARDKVVAGNAGAQPEAVTGPVALHSGIQEYQKEVYHGPALEEEFRGKQLVPEGMELRFLEMGHEVVVLPFYYIYPYSWDRDGQAFRDMCWAAKESFNAERCKDVVGVKQWPSYAITYWSHTWTIEGHHDENLQKISR